MLNRFLEHKFGAPLPHVLIESLRRVRRQEYEARLFNTNDVGLLVLICDDLAYFIHDLDPILVRHLEVKQHDFDRLYYPLQFFINELKGTLCCPIDQFLRFVNRELPVSAELTPICKVEKRNLVLNHTHADLLVICDNYCAFLLG